MRTYVATPKTIDSRWHVIDADGQVLGRVATLIWDARFSLVTTLLAGFGRAAAEVGTVMIVGGNIDGFTRTMTTTIALETSKGNLPLALGLSGFETGVAVMPLVKGEGADAAGRDGKSRELRSKPPPLPPQRRVRRRIRA